MTESIDIVQRKFIYLLLHNKDMVSFWLDSSLKVDHFSFKYHMLLRCIIGAYDKNTLLTRKNYLRDIQSKCSKQEAIEQEKIFNQCMISSSDENDFHYLKSEISDIYLVNGSISSIQEFRNTIEKSNKKTAIKKLVGSLEDLVVDSDENKYLYQDIAVYGKERLKYFEEVRAGKIQNEEKVLCNIKEIDETMGNGFAKGTLTLFCSDTSGFKSTIMLNIGLNIWQQNYNVLFVALEMGYDQMYSKLMAREAMIDSNDIFSINALTDEQMKKLNKVQNRIDDTSSKFYILAIPERATTGYIKRIIEREIDTFRPRIVIVDYIANLVPDRPRRDGRNDLEIGDMLKALRGMGKSFGCAIVSAAQIGRDGLKKIRKMSASNKDNQIVHSEDIRGSHEYSADADNIYAQFRNPSEPENLLDLYVIKARNGKTVFSDDRHKASLELVPAFSLIRSQSIDIPEGDDDFDEIMGKAYEETEKEDLSISDSDGDSDIDDLDNIVEW